MAKKMLIDALHPEETRVVIADNHQIYHFDFVSAARKQLKGNIYLAKITRVEPSLQACFVEYGGNKQGFLPFSEIHADYYQIPVSDRKRLMEESQQEDESTEAEPQAESAREPESYGDQPVTEQPQGTTLEPTAETENERPAYLSQPIESVAGEEMEMPEMPEDGVQPEPPTDATIAQADATEKEEALAEGADVAPETSAKSEGVETIASEEEEIRSRPKRNFFRRYKIQEVIRRGQIVLVQVIKEERGNKGVSLTTYLSLAGRYCVLMPNSPKDGGISRKIASQDDRKRLKAIYQELKLSAGMSVIIRTAGLDRTRAEIKRDYDYLVKLWNHIRETTLGSTAPALIHEESDIIKRAIRDQYTSDIDDLIVEGDEGYTQAKEFMKLLLPSHTAKIKHYKEATPLFYAYNVEDQLLSMHDPIVKLRSGGYIVINPTEALISIDVNSGRSTGERNIEETATKTNLEAVAEVARQLRLRDLAGLIVIDLIDMMESRNRRNVERALKDALKADRAKIQLGRISPFGLMEMSRQRLRPSISESSMMQCPHCIGRGVIRSDESMSIQMIRAIEKEAATGAWSGLRLTAPSSVALHLLNHKRDILRAIEQRHELTITVSIGADLAASEFNLEKMRRAQGERRRHEPSPRPQAVEAEAVNDNAEPSVESVEEAPAPREEPFTGEGQRRGRGRRGRRGGRGRNARGPREDGTPQTASAPSEEPPSSAGDKEQPHRGRPPRGRGRRPWRGDDRPAGHEPRGEAPTAQVLPAFATQEPKPAPEPKRQPEPVAVAAAVVESTPRDPNAPRKKGWWQKMIDLDEG